MSFHATRSETFPGYTFFDVSQSLNFRSASRNSATAGAEQDDRGILRPSFVSARDPPCDPPNAIGLATIYGQARPTYTEELVRRCLEQAPKTGLLVDLGCGTGISTRLFATTATGWSASTPTRKSR